MSPRWVALLALSATSLSGQEADAYHILLTNDDGIRSPGIQALAPEGGFDLVVSGINRGANVGTSSHMSGTVGAAMMGALYGIPAIAASLGGRNLDFDYPARFVARFIEELKRHPAMPGVVFSINIPAATEAEIGGVTVAPMGGSHLSFGYEEVGGGGESRSFSPRIGLETAAPAGSDTEAFLAGRITITPLRFDWTAQALVEEVRGWSLTPATPR